MVAKKTYDQKLLDSSNAPGIRVVGKIRRPHSLLQTPRRLPCVRLAIGKTTIDHKQDLDLPRIIYIMIVDNNVSMGRMLFSTTYGDRK